MAEVRIENHSAPASFKQRLGIGMAMVATAFPNGLTENEAGEILDRLFIDEAGYREQALEDLTRLLTSSRSCRPSYDVDAVGQEEVSVLSAAENYYAAAEMGDYETTWSLLSTSGDNRSRLPGSAK